MSKEYSSPIGWFLLDEVRVKLDLTMTEYMLMESISTLSRNSAGYCYANKETLGKPLNITKQYVHKLINKLIEFGYLEKNYEDPKLLKPTPKYLDIAYKNSKQSLPRVNNDSQNSKQSLLEDSKQSLPNNSINDISNIYNTKFENFDTYSDYLNSIETKETDAYRLLMHIQKNYPEVARMKKQMTYENAVNLSNKYSKKEIDLILNDMENWPPLVNKRKYVYNTIIAWLNKNESRSK